MDVNVLLFPDFETLDAFGPVEVLGRIEECCLHFVSANGGIIKSSQGVAILTEPLEKVVCSGVLLVPGGQGTRHLINDNMFIEKLSDIALQSQYCLTVCTGSALLAKANLLNGLKATSNKRAFDWVQSVNSEVKWISHARWVVDGKFYTSSGVSAGIDMALGFIADRFGITKAKELAQSIEYIWNSNKEADLFAR
ncbi:DJ-1/PfpI family protein [Sporomusa sp. KB1]|jgi:putative intracellular protease/amidase|uniref:DJ-1/PfpI family protein n=1 Tax=Sporomusa sp. KB1 TaxID=943346 RepID=UPI0011A49B13|nr:DJ-1/PfpI family protein [Sporomusa sp. KB1]TWH46411.1 Transcriptional regulator containing an amidase domain and an AraC-type DNA-binding HTH domain [Sporomusa sp. KB1]